MTRGKNTQIVVLAAGKGTRMKSDEPKALALLRGKPFLKHIIETIESINLPTKPVIVIGYKKERIKDTLGESHTYAEQHEQLGTGHAVMQTKNSLHPECDTILVLSTDQPLVSKTTIENILETHNSTDSIITLATVNLPDFEDWRAGLRNFGRIIRDRDQNVARIVEYKDANEEERQITEVNPALYAFDADWLWENIDKLGNENTQGEYYLTDLIKIAFNQGKKVQTVSIENILEALQPNTKEELEVLESLIV